MSQNKIKIGDIEIISIIELEAGEVIQSIIHGATTENIQKIDWLVPYWADKGGKLNAVVQSFLVKTPDKNILVDTCNGNDKQRPTMPEWSNLQIDFLQKLSDYGVNERQIDIVVCTHMHLDHVGWNTRLVDGKWIPTFPNAKYLFAKKEYEYWFSDPAREVDDDKFAFNDSVRPIFESGLAILVEENYRIDDNIRLVPTPGHTPCHVSVEIKSQDQKAIISGDFLHHPCQIPNSDWYTDADTDSEKATLTRKKMLKKLVNTDTILVGSHFAKPAWGKIRRVDGEWVFEKL